MSTIPAAFPNSHDNGWQSGMTLRDYFAGQVMAAVAADLAQDRNPIDPADLPWLTAKGAYLYADAMLAERAKGNSQVGGAQ
ncbi:hypothetical protein [Sphingomonas sp.]|uniref:hypothetical protein n=1 Tax=Sphingomonas sp. TaxID=28214 RepID=UPI0028AA4D86|nr:hypothetical protein [Sphingomonas sp.]